MGRTRTVGIAGLSTLALAAWTQTSHAQAAPPTPTTPTATDPAPPPERLPPKGNGLTGTSQSTTRTLGEVDSMDVREGTAGTTRTTSATYDLSVGAETTRRELRPNRPLLAIGSAMFIASYVGSAAVAGSSDLHADEKLFIPVVGPWLDIAERPCNFGECDPDQDVANAAIVAAGVTQAIGLGMAVASFFVPERAPEQRASVRVVPVSMGRGAGVGVGGVF